MKWLRAIDAGWKRVGIATLVGICLCLAPYGCGLLGSSRSPTKETVKEATKDGVKTIVRTVFEQDYSVLNVIGGLCALLAVGGILAGAAGLRPPGRLVLALIVCSAGAWTARYMLHEYMWLFALLSVMGILLAGVGIAITHRHRLERLLGIDLDGGGIGQ
jgi:hypothetical protein